MKSSLAQESFIVLISNNARFHVAFKNKIINT